MADSSFTENDANAANFKEIVGHIGLANNRLKQLIPSGEAHTQTVQEMQDYYERAIQDRQMRIGTLVETIAERERDLTAEKTALARMCFVLAACVVASALVLAPDQINSAMLFCAPYLTPDRVIGYAIAAVVAYGCGSRGVC